MNLTALFFAVSSIVVVNMSINFLWKIGEKNIMPGAPTKFRLLGLQVRLTILFLMVIIWGILRPKIVVPLFFLTLLVSNLINWNPTNKEEMENKEL